MPIAYELALLGSPTPEQSSAVEAEVCLMLDPFGYKLGVDVSWSVCPATFSPNERRATAVAYFGCESASSCLVDVVVAKGVPVVPVISELSAAGRELPDSIRALNALAYASVGARRVASALLECAGLLPRQRRVFLSYRRDKEAKHAALQLFEALSARRYDVFLDTHSVGAAEEFQTVLWHRLCESDVLIMLDTSTYFESRWTAAEFGRALAKGISVLRVGWPDVAVSPRASTAARVDLELADFTQRPVGLKRQAIERIITSLELVRSESIAVRRVNLVSKLTHAVQSIGGQVVGTGIASTVHFSLSNGTLIVAYPAIGVPTAESLHQAKLHAASGEAVVMYDPIGLSAACLGHLEWLGEHITIPRWLRATHAAWDLADWPPKP